jgi:PPOX class probable F420-dependent enzyme
LSTTLPEGLLALLRRPSPCFIATVMPHGSPQLTQTWVHTDGEHIQINIVDGMRKAKNIARDPRVAVNIADPDNVARYYAVRGRVIGSTTEGAADNIDEIPEVPGNRLPRLRRHVHDPPAADHRRGLHRPHSARLT